MDPKPQPILSPTENSTAASASVAFTSGTFQPTAQAQVSQPLSLVPTDQQDTLPPTSTSTEAANHSMQASVSTTSAAAPPSAVLHRSDAMPPQATPDQNKTTLQYLTTSQPTQSEQTSAPMDVADHSSTTPVASAVDGASTTAPGQPDLVAPANETTQAAPTLTQAVAAVSPSTSQYPAPATRPASPAAPLPTSEPKDPPPAPEPSSAPAPPAADPLTLESVTTKTANSVISDNKTSTETATAPAPEPTKPSQTQESAHETSVSISHPSASATQPTATTAATASIESASTNANAATDSAPQLQPQATAPAPSDEAAAKDHGKSDHVLSPKQDQVDPSKATASDQPKGVASAAKEQAAPSPLSVENVDAAPAVKAVPPTQAATASAPASAPATPERRSPVVGTSVGQSGESVPTTPARESRVALILRINKELIRLCVDLQSKDLTMDPIYREAAVRLQANLGYLASIADQAGKSVDPSGRAPTSGALPRLEPFPRSEHAPSSPIPALFDKLIALFSAACPSSSPLPDGRKRSRDSTADLGSDDPRKRAVGKDIDPSQDNSAAATPSYVSNQPLPTDAPTTTASEPVSSSTSAGQQSQQLAASASQAAQHQPHQSSKGPDLSLAPPVPIAPPAAAQNIANNPQAQALIQAFGPNALVNLHALQSHIRGQGTHPWVTFMEANISGYKAMPLQVQLQHMTSLQNAALQRQKAMGSHASTGSTSTVGSPATMPNGAQAGISSPATTQPVSRHSDSPSQALASPSASAYGAAVPGRAGTPLGGGQGAFQTRPGSSGSVGSMTSVGGRNRTGSSNLGFDASQMQSASSPATLGSMGEFAAQQQFGFQPPGLQQASPAASAASPTPQQQQGAAIGMPMSGVPNFQNLPPHLQHQIRQQYMAHMQAQAQAQGVNSHQIGFNPQQQ